MTGQFLQRRNSPANYYGCFLISLGAQRFSCYTQARQEPRSGLENSVSSVLIPSLGIALSKLHLVKDKSQCSRGAGWSSEADHELSFQGALCSPSRTGDSKNRLKKTAASPRWALPLHRPPSTSCFTCSHSHPKRSRMLVTVYIFAIKETEFQAS